jgi:iron(III) transport system permease protein
MAVSEHAPTHLATAAAASPGRFQQHLWMWTGERLIWAVLAVVVFWIAILPLIYTVDAAFYRETRVGLAPDRSLTAVLNVYATTEYWGYLASALVLAAIVTALSLVVGVVMALLVARTDIPLKGTFDLLIIMPLFLSPFTGMIAWIALGSEKTGFINGSILALFRTLGIELAPLINVWSFSGAVWVMFLFFCPFVYLFTIGNLRGMDSSLEEAARTTGATVMRTLWHITLPMSLPAVLAAGLLVFVLSAEMYTIPGIIGSNAGFTTLPWKIYEDSTVFPVRRAHAAAAGTLLLWVTILGIWLQRRITRQSERFVTVTGKGFRGRPLRLGAWKPAALAVIVVYVLSADVLPFGALLLSSMMKYSAPTINAEIFTLKHYHEILTNQSFRDALWNTLILALLSGAACVLIGFLITFMELRRPSVATRLLAFLGVLPVAVPGLVYGIGLLWVYLQTPLYGTIWILLLAFVAKFLPYGIVVSRSGVLQIHPELDQSARICGATALTSLRKIMVPLIKPTLIAILFFVMLQSIKELSASVLLYSQRSQVLSVLTWHYMDAGEYQFAAAIGIVQTILMIALVVVTRMVFGVQLEKAVAKT